MTSVIDKLADELDEAQHQAFEGQELIEPTDEEKRNGWTAETLTAYMAERQAGQSLAVDPNSLHRRFSRRKHVQNHRYNPHRWRG